MLNIITACAALLIACLAYGHGYWLGYKAGLEYQCRHRSDR